MIETWFPTLISCDVLSQFKPYNDTFAERAYKIKETTTAKHHWKCDTYSTIGTNYNMVEDALFSDLFQECNNKVLELAMSYGVISKRPKLVDAWFNIAEHGQFQEFHIHPRRAFSLVYYVKTAKGCGNILFKSQEAMTDMYPLESEIPNPASFNTINYQPEDSKVLVFRSNLNHMVEKNNSESDRISIAMNFILE